MEKIALAENSGVYKLFYYFLNENQFQSPAISQTNTRFRKLLITQENI